MVVKLGHFRKKYKKNPEHFEIWRWRKMQKISRSDFVKNRVLQTVKEERNILLLKRRKNMIGHMLRRNCLLKRVVEDKVEGKRRRGTRHKQLLDNLKEKR